MAVCRGCVAFCVGRVRGHGSRQPVKKQWWSLSQASEWRWIEQSRPLSSASWALGSPTGLRYQHFKQPALSHPFHHASQPQGAPCSEEDWDSDSVCVVEQPGQRLAQRSPEGSTLFGQLLALEAGKPLEFLFPLTTVDGSREDDISVGWRADPGKRSGGGAEREHGSFRRLFEAEGCPAPFMYGSRFYCFHCPAIQPLSAGLGLVNRPLELSSWLPVSLCSQLMRAEGGHSDRESEGEEKLALMYERLRLELPSFFLKSHDFTMYSNDVEFINGLLKTHTRGRVAYQLSLSLWRLLCLCYYAEARVEVLKLTKHSEDGTVKARWRIRGLPFHTLLFRFYKKDKSHLYRSNDAFSTFYIGHDGLIHCHKVEKVMQAQPPVLPRVRSLLAGALVALGLQEHRPALNLLPPLLSCLRQPRC